MILKHFITWKRCKNPRSRILKKSLTLIFHYFSLSFSPHIIYFMVENIKFNNAKPFAFPQHHSIYNITYLKLVPVSKYWHLQNPRFFMLAAPWGLEHLIPGLAPLQTRCVPDSSKFKTFSISTFSIKNIRPFSYYLLWSVIKILCY